MELPGFSGSPKGLTPGLPRTSNDFQILPKAVHTLFRPPLKKMLEISQEMRFDSDLNGNSPLRTTSAATEPRTLETHYAESEIQNPPTTANHLFFGSLRHNSLYFPEIFEPQPPISRTRFNYLKYAKASDITRNRIQGGPRLSIKHLTFSLDLRTKWDRFCLRSPKSLPTLHDISMELSGGEATALLYTNEHEMRTFLRLLTCENPPKGRLRGEITLNGHPLTTKQLARRTAHVSLDEPISLLTVKQFLKFTITLKRPATNAFKVDNMIDQLIQTLALSSFPNELIDNLGESEKQRLKIAVAVLKDTDILIVENIAKDLEIYDVAFVVDYLRDWAMKLNRIVIMAISPSSLQIFNMFHKSLILSSGRLVYGGVAEKMIDYFERHNFPCPSLKNPCDYYVDLVTHDHLSAESTKESMARIRFLADLWKKERSEILPVMTKSVSPPLVDANFFQAFVILYRRLHWVFFNHPFLYLREPILALLMSIFLGIIFYELTTDRRSGIEDRFGFVTSLLFFVGLLIGSINISTIHKERLLFIDDIKDRLYNGRIHLLSKLLFDFPFSIMTTLSATVPALLFSGIIDPSFIDDLHLVVHYSVLLLILHLYFQFWRLVSWNQAFFAKRKLTALFIYALLLTTSTIASGLLIHTESQGKLAKAFRPFTPNYLTVHPFMETIFLTQSQVHSWLDLTRKSNRLMELLFDCDKHSIFAAKIKEVPIYMIARCARIRGTHVLYAAGFPPFSVQNISTIQLKTTTKSPLFHWDPSKAPDLSFSLLAIFFLYLSQFLNLLFVSGFIQEIN